MSIETPITDYHYTSNNHPNKLVYIDEAADIGNAIVYKEPSLPEKTPALTKEKYLEILDQNYNLYRKLKGQCHGYFCEVITQIVDYNTKITTAKTQEKKRYYNKKKIKASNIYQELLVRMESLDSAISRVQEKKAELLEQ